MEKVRAFIKQLQQAGLTPGTNTDAVRSQNRSVTGIYAESLAHAGGATFFLARVNGDKHLICWGDLEAAKGFEGDRLASEQLAVLPASTANAGPLHKLFPFTRPVPVAKHRTTIGTGDRLGIATPGHVDAVENFDAIPVLAQQSIRELRLTERTYPDVVAAASWGVFQKHWTRGFAADGDHLKTEREIEDALKQGATMITLDCSDYIKSAPSGVETPTAEALPQLASLEERYLNREHPVRSSSGEVHSLQFTQEKLAEAARTYGDALHFTQKIFVQFIAGSEYDFELSIDETQTPTDPAAHYFIASELQRAGVRVTSVAPRFCGEFQKGIDYIGDVAQFERELAIHAAIADHFDYKLSIHSGSDKFAVFPIIGRYTQQRVHVKTAGTSWLEAVRLIAIVSPDLFRAVHAHALRSFPEAAKYYHVGTRPDQLDPIDSLADADLPGLLDHPGHRQLLHITYGLILTADNGDGPNLRTDSYRTLNSHETEHYAQLAGHIGRHLELLGVSRLG